MTLRWLIRRLVSGSIVLALAATVVFFLIRFAPGDPYVEHHLTEGTWTTEQLAVARERAGIDQPRLVQYIRWAGQTLRGNLGYSPHHQRPVADIIRASLPITLTLTIAALLADFLVGIAVALFQARRPGTFADHALSVVTLTIAAVPIFWFGTILIMVFSEWAGVLPPSGIRSVDATEAWTFWARVLDRAQHTLLPAATLGLVGAAVTARFQRSAVAEVLRLDFVRAARARGLGDRRILIRHVLRNALLPTITLAGLSLPLVIGGSVLVETVFGWAGGMGSIAARAVGDRDYDLIAALTITVGAMVVIGNIIADGLYRIADPRTGKEHDS